jgi:hypothetical protein
LAKDFVDTSLILDRRQLLKAAAIGASDLAAPVAQAVRRQAGLMVTHSRLGLHLVRRRLEDLSSGPGLHLNRFQRIPLKPAVCRPNRSQWYTKWPQMTQCATWFSAEALSPNLPMRVPSTSK